MVLAVCKCGASFRWLTTSRPFVCDSCTNRAAMIRLAERDVMLVAELRQATVPSCKG